MPFIKITDDEGHIRLLSTANIINVTRSSVGSAIIDMALAEFNCHTSDRFEDVEAQLMNTHKE